MQHDYDAIVIGAGHNGLTSAAYMAKAGLKVAVFEKNSWVGGMSSTYEFIPGYKFGTGAMYFGAMPPLIREDLELYEHGLQEEVTLPWVFCPLPDGKYFTEYFPDTDKTCAFLEQNFTKQDAVAYRKWAELWGGLNEALGPVMMNVPPSFADFLSMFQAPLEQAGARKVLFYSLAELLDELGFVSDGPKGYLAHMANDIGWGGPMTPGTALGCGFHFITPKPYEVPIGSMGSLVSAIAEVAKERGAEIFTETRVERIVIRDGVATGLVVDGREVTAKAVISTLDPKTTLLGLIGPEHLDAETIELLPTAKSRNSSAEVFFALKELPDYTAVPGKDPTAFPHRAAQIICPSLEYAENCFDDWKYGRISKRLSLVQLNESVFDPRMAPAGKFTAKILITAVPYELAEGSWDDPAVKQELATNVIDTITEFAPNFRDAIIDQYVFTPLDFERVFGNYNWAHVDVRPDQMFGYRPMPGWSGYQTPIPHLYFGGASTHGGPAVSGVPGHNVAEIVIESLVPALAGAR
jgi:phytoene dehydrogenase-like protein